MTVEKLFKDGKVAVIYSPGYGAGWSTRNSENADSLVFDRNLAEAVIANDLEKVKAIALSIDPNMYLGGASKLAVYWLPVGTAFRINEHDGYESVEVLGDVDWMTA